MQCRVYRCADQQMCTYVPEASQFHTAVRFRNEEKTKGRTRIPSGENESSDQNRSRENKKKFIA